MVIKPKVVTKFEGDQVITSHMASQIRKIEKGKLLNIGI